VREGDQALNFIYLLGFLVLVASSFAVRRAPIGASLKMFAAWGLLFAVAFLAFTLKDDFLALGRRMVQEVRGEGKVVQSGEELRIHKAADGHFWVDARVNGESVGFLIDSGATITSLSTASARSAGVEPSSRIPVLVDTANGTVAVARARARIKVGTIERDDMAVHISDSDDTNVLGMNFLSSLSGWRVEGEWLVLRP
jgi:aspartyl protease family protein